MRSVYPHTLHSDSPGEHLTRVSIRAMVTPNLLYSTNTWLAFAIAERYYNGEHWVWCTPYFDPSSQASLDIVVPPSSSPSEINRLLREDVLRGDRHSAKIQSNRAGILRGATSKRAAGVITEQQESEIVSIVESAEPGYFKPFLYVIPYAPVAALLREVPIRDRAHPFSKEYIIEQLPRKLFDVIEIPTRS